MDSDQLLIALARTRFGLAQRGLDLLHLRNRRDVAFEQLLGPREPGRSAAEDEPLPELLFLLGYAPVPMGDHGERRPPHPPERPSAQRQQRVRACARCRCVPARMQWDRRRSRPFWTTFLTGFLASKASRRCAFLSNFANLFFRKFWRAWVPPRSEIAALVKKVRPPGPGSIFLAHDRTRSTARGGARGVRCPAGRAGSRTTRWFDSTGKIMIHTVLEAIPGDLILAKVTKISWD